MATAFDQTLTPSTKQGPSGPFFVGMEGFYAATQKCREPHSGAASAGQRDAIGFDVESGWKKIATDPRNIESSWYGNPYRWWSDIMDIEPLNDFLKLDIPIIIGVGEQDKSVPSESARFLAAQFKEADKRNLILNVYPGADHRLNSNSVSYRSDLFSELSRLLQTIPNSSAKWAKPQAVTPLP